MHSTRLLGISASFILFLAVCASISTESRPCEEGEGECQDATGLVQKWLKSTKDLTEESARLSAPSASSASSSQFNAFPQGVAAGDATRTSAVLWARVLAVGWVGFYVKEADATWQASDYRRDWVQDVAKPAKVKISGLKPGTKYDYWVEYAWGSKSGSFTTAGAIPGKPLRFGAAGDWRGVFRPYVSIRNVVSRDLRFFIELGDTVYADYAEGETNFTAETLEEFRQKHIEVYSEKFGENYWADVRSNTNIYATIDDHEVVNNFQGGALHAPVHFGNQMILDHFEIAGGPAPAADTMQGYFNQGQLYRNGLQSFHEYNPIEDSTWQGTGDPVMEGRPKLYRYREFGPQACMIMVDARSFRDEELFFESFAYNLTMVQEFIKRSYTEDRTMLGRSQLGQLKRDLLACNRAGITWKFLVVSIPMQAMGFPAAQDRWYGYAAERNSLLKFIQDEGIQNVVFLSADIHATFISDVAWQPLGFIPSDPPEDESQWTNTPCASQPTATIEVTTGSVAMVALSRQLVQQIGDIPFSDVGFDIPLTYTDLLLLAVSIFEFKPVLSKDAFYSLPLRTQDKYSIAGVAIASYFFGFAGGLNYNPPGFGFPPCSELLGRIQAFQDVITSGNVVLVAFSFLWFVAYILQITAGPFTALNSYGWTEFEITPNSKRLKITTYGIPDYSEDEITTSILQKQPEVLSFIERTAV